MYCQLGFVSPVVQRLLVCHYLWKIRARDSSHEVIIWKLNENGEEVLGVDKRMTCLFLLVFTNGRHMLNGKHPISPIFITILQPYKLLSDFTNLAKRVDIFFLFLLNSRFQRPLALNHLSRGLRGIRKTKVLGLIASDW